MLCVPSHFGDAAAITAAAVYNGKLSSWFLVWTIVLCIRMFFTTFMNNMHMLEYL